MARQMMLKLLLLSLAVTVSTQLAPVYNPGGGGGAAAAPAQETTVVVATPAAVSPTVPAEAKAHAPRTDFVTKTVYGFLDFTTTVGSTVMIFTPQSQSAKPKPSKTRDPTLPPRSSRFTLPPSAPKLKPTPTIPKLSSTPAPSPKETKLPVLTSSTLESSFFEPHTALAIENLFSVTPEDIYGDEIDYIVESSPVQEFPQETVKAKELQEEDSGRSSNQPHKPFRRPSKPFELPPGTRRRPDLNYFLDRKKPSSTPRPQGGSTIVPITVEGTGTISPKFSDPESRVTSVILNTPSEVIVSATQGFATISVIGPFKTAVDNELGQVSEHYDFLVSEPPLNVQEAYDVYEVEPTASMEILHSSELVTSDSSFPTGLVTKLGGTIVSDGLTTVHETSVIGTYIAGHYAQILQSTSHIFQTTPTPELKLSSPSVRQTYETVKSVIKGSATQFITPDSTSALPLQSLFSEPVSKLRNSRKTDDSQLRNRPSANLSKRLGPHQGAGRLRSQPDDDPYVDLQDEDDLQKAGSNPRASFRFRGATSVRPTQPVSTFYAQEVKPTTFRRSFSPSGTRRLGNNRPATSRPRPPGPHRQGNNRFRANTSSRPKVNVNRRPVAARRRTEEQQIVQESKPDPLYLPDPDIPGADALQEETLQVVTSTPVDGPTDLYYEMATIRSLHTFRVGTTKNTRYVTFTKTFTHGADGEIVPTSAVPVPEDEIYETQLFENILDEGPRDVSTLPPIDLGENDVAALLETVTETFSTTELMMKTSVLPVLQGGETSYYSLTQTYHITRVVTALKTMPPVEAFSFIPENSLNEFNDHLLAEGTETGESLHPGELEYDENGELIDTGIGTRVRPPPGFPFEDPDLADLAGGPFDADAFEKQSNPQLAAALEQRQQLQQQQGTGGTPQLASGQQSPPVDPATATPSLSPEQLQQLAYLRLLNPFSFGGLPQLAQQPQTTVTSTPVTITTDLVTTSTRVIRVIFNARPIFTTLSSVETVHTTLTTFSTQTVTISPSLSPFSFPFAGAFPVG
ncbi:mucin-2-like isoform X2 [Macrobrachium nipponense]|uniref:mucin-2-like isoform X2 n=1 Tax=Macrobrachium nipponense TaxID=159736 RepID=UPI0030C7CE89